MIEYRRSTVAAWVVGANVQGFWSLSGARPLMPTDATPTTWSQHEMVEFLLSTWRSVGNGRQSALDVRAAQHSTSWLPLANGTWDAFNYLAAVTLDPAAEARVEDRWPDAVPIGRREFDRDGPQPDHAAIDPPDGILWSHVAAHALRHYRLLTNPHCDAYNPTVAAAVAGMNGPEPGRSWFAIHLEQLKGAPAGELDRDLAGVA
jgi:hypothetical protein